MSGSERRSSGSRSPRIRVAVEQFERSTHDSAIRDLQAIRTLVRRVSSASSFAEAAQAAVDAVSELLAPTSIATAILAPRGDSGQIISAGARAHIEFAYSSIVNTCIVANYPNRFGHTTFSEERPAYRQTEKGAFDFEQRIAGGASFRVTVADSATPPSASGVSAAATLTESDMTGCISDAAVSAIEYWDWNAKLLVCSTMTHGLFTDGGYRGNLCALWTEPRRMSPMDAEILRIASAIVELATAPAPLTEQRAMSR